MNIKKKILISPNFYQKLLCELFMKEVYSTNKEQYEKRNQTNKNKVQSDIYIGKMAEFAVWNYLIKCNKLATFPDIGIYPKNLKSFDADIISKDIKVHVKSCNDIGVFPNSWLFQPNDTLCTFPSDKDFIAFVVCYPDNKFESYFIQANKIINLYKIPIKINLNKKVIYEEDLIKIKL